MSYQIGYMNLNGQRMIKECHENLEKSVHAWDGWRGIP